jgi:hypothetical protein
MCMTGSCKQGLHEHVRVVWNTESRVRNFPVVSDLFFSLSVTVGNMAIHVQIHALCL